MRAEKKYGCYRTEYKRKESVAVSAFLAVALSFLISFLALFLISFLEFVMNGIVDNWLLYLFPAILFSSVFFGSFYGARRSRRKALLIGSVCAFLTWGVLCGTYWGLTDQEVSVAAFLLKALGCWVAGAFGAGLGILRQS